MSFVMMSVLGAMPGAVAAEGEEINVVCTNSVLADFAVNVIGDGHDETVTVEFIMPAGVCPSHFDTSPSDVVTIAEADVIISLGWEPWLSDLVEASGNDDAYEIKCMGLGEWNIPSGAEAHIEAIADGLSGYMPEWTDDNEANAAAYSADIYEAYENARLAVEAQGFNGTKVVAIEWYTVFLEGLGFDVVLAYGAPEGLSTADVLNVSATLEDPEIAMVVDNLQSSIDFGSNVASESGKVHVVLSNFPGAIPGMYTYLENFEYNVNELLNAAAAYENTREEISDLESQVSDLEFQRTALAAAVGVLAVLLAVTVVIARRR
jgi:ABC-type Zn uptake system ZnuABC Zn-binding protein ZnuA